MPRKRGGAKLGHGAFGEVVDEVELRPYNAIEFFDNNMVQVSLPETVWKKELVFKRFPDVQDKSKSPSIHDLTKSIKSKVKNVNSSDGTKGSSRALTTEIANMITITRLGISSPAFVYGDRPIIYAIVDGRDILTVYQRYDEDLHSVLQKRPLKLDEVKSVARMLLETTQALHENGLYHFDIKPANILYKASAGKFVLSDFGSVGSIYTSGWSGTPKYQSPLTNFAYRCSNSTNGTQNKCMSTKESYKDVRDYFIHTVLDFLEASRECKSKGKELEYYPDMLEKCMEHEQRTVDLSKSISQRQASKLSKKFADTITYAIGEVCQYGKSVTESCPQVSFIANKLMRIVYQKNELHAIGMTLRDVLELVPDAYTQKQVFNELIDKLINATLFNGNTNAQDFYYCDEALEWMDQNI